MKVSYLKIKNVGLIEDTQIELNKPLLLFYGEIRAGKSTILNAVRWCMGGSFPQDIIRHGAEEAEVEIGLDGGLISRSWYKAKDGTTKAREITFVRDGRPVGKPATEIAKLLNPFLLNQNHLVNMGETERKKFFVDLFAVDTKDLDVEAFNASREAESLRSEIKGFGEIDLTPVPESNLASLRLELQNRRRDHAQRVVIWNGDIQSKRSEWQRQCKLVDESNKSAEQNNIIRGNAEREIRSIDYEILSLEKKVESLKISRQDSVNVLEDHPLLTFAPYPDEPDTGDIQERISTPLDTAELENKIVMEVANDSRRGQFERNQERAKEKEEKQKRVSELEARQREIKVEKAAKLKTVSDQSGIKDLAFDEEGNFRYQDTDAGMLSTSQLMALSSALSDLYPEGFGLDLIDRAESLGKSIFDFIKKAQDEEKTILATIVGEAPATAPPEVGVFVVEAGKVKGGAGQPDPKPPAPPAAKAKAKRAATQTDLLS